VWFPFREHREGQMRVTQGSEDATLGWPVVSFRDMSARPRISETHPDFGAARFRP
jgi:hypothetical protein